jgi:hypothetical protein
MTPETTDSNDLSELGLDAEAKRVDGLAREVLGDNYVSFRVESLEMKEDFEAGKVSLSARLSRFGAKDQNDIEGEGVGLVDAFFDGVMKAFSTEYPSLKTLAISDFSLSSGFDGVSGRRSDAVAMATLRIRNSEDIEYAFSRGSPSITRSSVRATLDALTFFINSERAYVQLHVALQDAKQRRRSDLVERFRAQMGTLVTATSYSEVIENLRNENET